MSTNNNNKPFNSSNYYRKFSNNDHFEMKQPFTGSTNTNNNNNQSLPLLKRKSAIFTCFILFFFFSILLLLSILLPLTLLNNSKNEQYFPKQVSYTPSNHSIHFLVIGDWGRANQEQRNVANAMNNFCKNIKTCNFLISTGDNIYDNGVVNEYDKQFKDKFEDIYYQYDILKDLNFYTIFGNHDYRTNPMAQIEYGKINLKWKFPSPYYELFLDSTTNPNLSFNISFLFTDTIPYVEKYATDGKTNLTAYHLQNPFKENGQYQWLQNKLEENYKNNIKWNIVLGHHPVYSAGAHYNQPEMLKYYEPLFKKYKIPLYLSGHDHLLNWLINKDELGNIPKNGNGEYKINQSTNYIISGGGAGSIKGMKYNKNCLNYLNASGFFSIEIQEGFIFVIALDEYGKELWKFRIDK